MREYLHDEYWNKADLQRVNRLKGNSLEDFIQMGVLSPVQNEFFTSVKQAFRGCELRANAPDDATNRSYFGMWVYMPEDTFAMGRVSVGVTEDNEDKYIVSSHKVQNNKHNGYSKEHRQCSTIRIKTGIKNAKKYLQRLTHVEMVKATSHRCYDKVEEFVSKQRDVMNQSFSMAFDTTITPTASSLPVYIKELFHLSDVGHSFLDKELEGAVQTAQAEYKSYRSVREDAKSDMYYVRVYERLGAQVFDVSQTKYHTSVYETTRGATFIGSMTEDELPEGVIEKVSAMSLCGHKEYVPQVGYRYDENIFYVTQ
tara:strand:+ start:585 stop:1520 length:936 start_codon:yes stop_codon:yes gene_type:complete